MKNINVLIVDDEQLAREDIKHQLSSFENIIIIGETDNLNEAIGMYSELKPDLIFLDIQLGNESGFDLMNTVEADTKIVFVTAYDEFAIKAFEVNALDYLLKPVSGDRLEQTIDRLATKSSSQNEQTTLSIDDNIFIKLNDNYRFLKIDTIKVICSAKDYSEIYIDKETKSYLTLKTLKEWEERLPVKQFCRIHRTTIINLNYIVKIEPWHNYSQRVYLKDIEEPYLMSRRFFSAIKEKLG